MNQLFYLAPPVLAFGAANLILHVRRQFRGLGLRGAVDLASLPITPIAEARTGRVKFCGKARGTGTVQSTVNRVACIAHRRAIWSQESVNGVGVVRKYSEMQAFPFELDDGSGAVLTLDPRDAIVDYETLSLPSGGSEVEEQYLRDGDTLVVVGNIEVDTREGYRDHGAPQVRFVEPPLISWRSEPETLPRLTPPLLSTALTLFGAAATTWACLVPHNEVDVPILVGVGAISLAFGAIFAFGKR